jgi:hypothetical protein
LRAGRTAADTRPPFLGSAAAKIVRHSPVPVTVVPRGVAAELAGEALRAERGRA